MIPPVPAGLGSRATTGGGLTTRSRCCRPVSLRVQYVRCLSEIVEPAIQFLAKAGDPFMRQRIVVPTAGTKAWLQAVLASRLGASGPDRGDGIVANVEIAYPGAIATFLQPTRTAADPWDIDRLTSPCSRHWPMMKLSCCPSIARPRRC